MEFCCLPLRRGAVAGETFLFILRERAHVIDHVPTLCCFGHPSLTGRHNPPNPFRNLPEDFAVGHRGHPLFVREIRGLAAQFGKIRFVAGAGITVTKDAVAFGWIQIERFSSLDRFRRCGRWVLRLVGILGKFPRVLGKILLRTATGRDRTAVVLIPVGSGG